MRLIGTILLVTIALSACADLPVVVSRTARTEIVCPEKPHAAERFAAEELSRWIGEMTGALIRTAEAL